jgi:hypothetical protein
MEYRPPLPGNSYQYDELVVFQEQNILPQFVVHLQNMAIATPSAPRNTVESWTSGDVSDWVKGLRLSQDYTSVIISNSIQITCYVMY